MTGTVPHLDKMLMIDYSATKLQNGHDILLSTELTNAYQYISCYVMCDEIGRIRVVNLF